MADLLCPRQDRDWISVSELTDRLQSQRPATQILKWKHVTELVVQLYLEKQQQTNSDQYNLNQEFEELRSNAKVVILKSDQSTLLDLSFCDFSILRLPHCIRAIEAQNIRALSLRNLSVDSRHLIADLNQITSLRVLNISGVVSQSRITLGELSLPDLQFLNISKLRLTDEVVSLQGCPSLSELICHSNNLESLEMFFHLDRLQLLDVENNSIQTYLTPKNLKVLNIKGNPDASPQTALDGLIVNPVDGVANISLFQKLGELAFGDECEQRAAQRIIKVNSSIHFKTQDTGVRNMIASPSSLFDDNTNTMPNFLSPQSKLLTPTTARIGEQETEINSQTKSYYQVLSDNIDRCKLAYIPVQPSYTYTKASCTPTAHISAINAMKIQRPNSGRSSKAVAGRNG